MKADTLDKARTLELLIIVYRGLEGNKSSDVAKAINEKSLEIIKEI